MSSRRVSHRQWTVTSCDKNWDTCPENIYTAPTYLESSQTDLVGPRYASERKKSLTKASQDTYQLCNVKQKTLSLWITCKNKHRKKKWNTNQRFFQWREWYYLEYGSLIAKGGIGIVWWFIIDKGINIFTYQWILDYIVPQ